MDSISYLIQPVDPHYATSQFGDHRTLRRNPDNLLLKMDGFKTTLLLVTNSFIQRTYYRKDTVFSFI